jgi:hypothetical protein
MSSRYRRALAATVALTTALFVMPAPLMAGTDAQLAGRVFDSDGITPRPGVVVTLVEEQSQVTFSSQPTDDKGIFRIDDAAAGGYRLLAETPEGAFLAADHLELQQGANKPLSLTLAPARTTPGGAQQGMEPWLKWTIAGGIIVTGLLLILEVTDDKEEGASPAETL